MNLGLTDKIAVVGASSKGLGRAIALGLAQEGAKITICARDSDILEATADDIRKQTGTEVLAVPTDVSQPEQVENLIHIAIDHFGGIDILVNNAGGPRA
ncbi:MAG: SDR family NAD(P)-dependent oxidoreductase, partial [Candidatus Poribacteria bacterium]|nr:SDR family NAD(P)-dependent oxidoreductase [Candidatus Poribacteria bacterium]